MREPGDTVDVGPELVRAAVPEGGDHTPQRPRRSGPRRTPADALRRSRTWTSAESREPARRESGARWSTSVVRRFASMSRNAFSTAAGVRPVDRRDLGGRDPVVVSPQAQVHLLVREREVELVLSLRERVRVGRRPAAADLFRNAQRPSHRVDLGLVQVRDRLEIRRAVSALHEEALVVLEAVRRPGHGVVELLRPEVLRQLPRALLHVGRGDDRRDKPPAAGAPVSALPSGACDDETEHVQPCAVADLRQHDLRAPARAVLRETPSGSRRRAPGSTPAPRARERSARSAMGSRTAAVRDLPSVEALIRRVGLGHEQAEDALGAERAGRERRRRASCRCRRTRRRPRPCA